MFKAKRRLISAVRYLFIARTQNIIAAKNVTVAARHSKRIANI
jgi:hypothetical protein